MNFIAYKLAIHFQKIFNFAMIIIVSNVLYKAVSEIFVYLFPEITNQEEQLKRFLDCLQRNMVMSYK